MIIKITSNSESAADDLSTYNVTLVRILLALLSVKGIGSRRIFADVFGEHNSEVSRMKEFAMFVITIIAHVMKTPMPNCITVKLCFICEKVVIICTKYCVPYLVHCLIDIVLGIDGAMKRFAFKKRKAISHIFSFL